MKLPQAIARDRARARPTGDISTTATVAVVNGDGTVDLSAPSGTVPKVRRLAHYSATVGDKVVMVRTASGDRYVVGKLA